VLLNPGWNAEKILQKTGIRTRPITVEGETAGDLGCRAAERLLDEIGYDRKKIDALVFCTESPDYILPATACLMHHRLGLKASCAAFDYNLGCSGFTYGLWLSKALIDSASAHNVLLIVGDTFARHCNPHDLMTATIFADGAAASLVTRDRESALASIGPTVLGTDGSGGAHLILRNGGARSPRRNALPQDEPGGHGEPTADDCLFMNGPGVYSFTLARVPDAIHELLRVADLCMDNIDLFLFHQANRYMLENLAQKMQIPLSRIPIDLEELGNAASAALPILVRRCLDRGLLQPGKHYVLAGFGVGLSWAVTLVEWL